MYPHERSLVKRLAGEPFALIGVNSDKDRRKLKRVLKTKRITWRSFWNGPRGKGGPISKAWKVKDWPTIYVIDHEGIIRYKKVGGPTPEQAINKLLADLEASLASSPSAGEHLGASPSSDGLKF